MSVLVLPFIVILLLSIGVNGEGSGCSSHNSKELEHLRVEQLRLNILAQLGITDPPPQESTPPPEDEIDVLGNYDELYEASSSTEAKCTSGDFYAKPISSFVGVLTPTEGEERYMLLQLAGYSVV